MAKGGNTANSGGKDPNTGLPMIKNCSPAAGIGHSPAGTGASVGFSVGGSVLGTGVNPDLKTYGSEAV